MDIRLDDLSHPAVQALLGEHLAGMFELSPPESVHALDLDRLRAPDITFWTAWEGDALLGCGALKQLDAHHGELKSMRTARPHLRRGVGAALLAQILDAAHRRGLARLSLETGSVPGFDPARRLYARFGFAECGPFADYAEDPYSVFMTRTV
jgi:putative acetyltransferase